MQIQNTCNIITNTCMHYLCICCEATYRKHYIHHSECSRKAAPLFGERFVIINIANSSLWTCAKILRVTSQSWRLFRPRAINLHIQGVRCEIFQKQKTAPFFEESSGFRTHFGFTNTELKMHRFNFTAIWFWKIPNHTLCNTTSEVHHKDITFKTTSKAANKRPTDEVDDDLWQRMLRVNSTRKSDLKVNFCTPLSWTKEGKTWMYLKERCPSQFLKKKYQGEFKEACKIHFVSDPAALRLHQLWLQ